METGRATIQTTFEMFVALRKDSLLQDILRMKKVRRIRIENIVGSSTLLGVKYVCKG